MLPKVATTILHSTGRAAAAVHTQSHHIRSVLQLQSPSSAKGSPGSGYFNSNNSGSRGGRFTHGYYGASRAVTQANPTVAVDDDGGYIQIDEQDEQSPLHANKNVSSRPGQRRFRSNSLSQGSHEQRLTVLKSVKQLKAHSRNALEVDAVRCSSTSSTQQSDNDMVSVEPPPIQPASGVDVPHATTTQSSIDAPPAQSVNPPPLSPTPPQPQHSSRPSSPVTDVADTSSPLVRDLRLAQSAEDRERVTQLVLDFLDSLGDPSFTRHLHVHDFNEALRALRVTRPAGEPLDLVQRTYNALLEQGLHPDRQTYLTLIHVVLDRDKELNWATKRLRYNQKMHDISKPFGDGTALEMKKLQALTNEMESTHSTALSLFHSLRTLQASPHVPFPTPLLAKLLSSCAAHNNLKGGVLVWEVAQSDVKHASDAHTLPGFLDQCHAQMYTSMMQLFVENNVYESCRFIFDDFQQKFPDAEHVAYRQHMYNFMMRAHFQNGKPELAITMLDDMLSGQDSTRPSLSTYETIIVGFARILRDIDTALLWFNRLLDQPHSPKDIKEFVTLDRVVRPNKLTWRHMLEVLADFSKDELAAISSNAQSEMPKYLDILNSLYTRFKSLELEDDLGSRAVDAMMVAQANFEGFDTLLELFSASPRDEVKQKALSYIGFLQDQPSLYQIYRVRRKVCKSLFAFGEVDQAKKVAATLELEDWWPSFRSYVTSLFSGSDTVDLKTAMSIRAQWKMSKTPISDLMRIGVLNAYAYQRESDISFIASLPPNAFYLFLNMASSVEAREDSVHPILKDGVQWRFGRVGLFGMLQDIATLQPDFVLEATPLIVRTSIITALCHSRTVEELLALLENLPNGGLKNSLKALLAREGNYLDSESGGEELATLASGEAVSTAPTSPVVDTATQESTDADFEVSVDRELNKRIDSAMVSRGHHSKPSPLTNYIFNLFADNLYKHHLVPNHYTLSRLIAFFGRIKELDKVQIVYSAAQALLRTMDDDKQAQSEAWFAVEDAMIIAFAQCGEIDMAHVHRMRILQQGGTPSADAYGGLVLHVKDTTDDTTNAMELYREAVGRGVRPNLYLYNNIISKLSKARKADAAIELFTQMKRNGDVFPSPITYGAVIGACARVGDVVSAEMLFREMVSQRNFRPRVPPFNTMMQLYTTTKPDREKALYYYSELIKARVQPTEYTIKLLMEAYALDPIDLPNLQRTFDQLVNSPNLQLQSTHFATLINAYGCILKDLPLAIQTFESILTHPRKPTLDALAFEAIVNVLVAHRRMDLVPAFVEKMNEANVHMTAYIANGLIKGYSAVGEIERAREIFEGMADPPSGMAALHNRVPHMSGNGEDGSALRGIVGMGVDPMAPVYREPSSWEAIVRAELGAGERERAVGLVARMEQRQYPEAVVNRVRGIMVDHSQVLL